MQVPPKLCGSMFSENIGNLLVSCDNGNNDRAAWMLFVNRFARFFDIIIRPDSLGASLKTPAQPRSLYAKHIPCKKIFFMSAPLLHYVKHMMLTI